jgi:uncharacterized iron-regulated membrane protein
VEPGVNTLFRVSVIVMSVSGIVMSVKLRPAGAQIGAPPRPASVAHDKGALLIPFACRLFGLTLLAVILPDVLNLSAIPPLTRLVT